MPSSKHEIPSARFGCDYDCCGEVPAGACIDIVARFASRYRIEYEDPHFAGSACPWHRQVVCRFGFVAPSGRQRLYAYGRGVAAKALAELTEQDERFVMQAGSNTETGITFDVEHFAPVAVILKPKRR